MTPGVHGIRGQRYGEVLLVYPGSDTVTADVYNSFGLNDCPQELWSKLDATQLAKDNAAAMAILNGPRYWLMDSITKYATDTRAQETKDFGGIAMFKAATVNVGDLGSQGPYTAHAVDRRTVFTYDAGSEVYELVDPAGTHWIMQTWSQVVDPTLAQSDLAALSSRLSLPAGWTYTVRTMSAPLAVDTTTTDAQVLQDSLNNSYSRRTSA